MHRPLPNPPSAPQRAPLRAARAPLLAALAGAWLCATGSPAAAQVTVDWSIAERGNAIAVDAQNSVYTVDFEQALGKEIVLTKRDVNGNLLWQASYDQTDRTKWEAASWVTVDHAGNVIVTGTSMSGFSNPVNAASIAMKFDADGNLLWRNVYESSFDGSSTRRCLVDANDNVYVLGLGNGPSGLVAKIKKFDPSGNTVWDWYDTSGVGSPLHFKLSPDGFLLVTGRGITGAINGYAKVDLAGQTVWGINLASYTIGDLAGDTLGNTYVLSSESLPTARNVLKKLDPAGAQLWETRHDLLASRIEIGPDDLAVACGYPVAGFGSAFLKVDANGNEVWKNLDADGALNLLLHAQMAIDARGAAYLAAGTLFDMAVCKVNPDGSSAWTATTRGSYAYAMALGPQDSSVFVVGGNTARLLDETGSPWTDLGRGLAGAAGVPHLRGIGDLTASSAVELHLDGAAPNALALLVIGASRIDLPLFGGTLVPSPDVVIGGLVTDGAGHWSTLDTWPDDATAGDDWFVQAWIADLGAPRKLAASNALRLVAR
ncbi:MAG: hypothetical protein JNL90_15265 [Planctomycetes bacterium]|nr:hypothetical protein [Planctomycetota bacterium]